MAVGKTFAFILFQDAARIEHDVLTIEVCRLELAREDERRVCSPE